MQAFLMDASNGFPADIWYYEKNFAFLAKQVIIHNNEKQQKQTDR